jgi:hypothetical protein
MLVSDLDGECFNWLVVWLLIGITIGINESVFLSDQRLTIVCFSSGFVIIL